ncbi:class I SAM-dependent methyltransferase [Streptomyces roseifaciens]|uniref:class I SAM-dependent methyltransferase n=1 Tax=Streptomyces roseifaciens TaxID=1488406 RepID=UPI00071820FD|nr:class I SAM-dependent methyltransferase [Streptomyces roseifaciens]
MTIQEPVPYWDGLWSAGHRYRPLDETETALLDRHAGAGRGRYALDIGSGDGTLTRHLARLGYRTTALDCAPTAIALAADQMAGEAVTFCCGDIEAPHPPPLPESAYALITARLVYAFIKDKPAFLDRVRSLLAPGGLLWVVTPMADRVPPDRASIGITITEEELLVSGWSVACAADMDNIRCFALRP